MIWLIFGIFYLLLVCFFIGAFALSRRADDNIDLAQKRTVRAEQPAQSSPPIKIHRLYKTEAGDNASIVARPASQKDPSPPRRLAS